MNKLSTLHKKARLNFTAANIGKFDYKMLMQRPFRRKKPEISDMYYSQYNNLVYRLREDKEDDSSNYNYVFNEIRNQFLQEFGDIDVIVDNLVYELFKNTNSSRKKVFWNVFGDVVYNNILNNLDLSQTQCKGCGIRFNSDSKHNKYCPECTKRKQKAHLVGYDKVLRRCKDCGKGFLVGKSVNSKFRCDKCQAEYRKAYDRERKRRNKLKKMNETNERKE